ncbi:bifunctional riboflavin kinase/FAD synthetase [Fusibacter ferrireducens]|uniref:Riboflavin biosynthesis protein n=1 Tax=Fusibacter ferrireducens TaxID=2785058 RepID=A0ABR9ZMT8_9FIRM|nr:bifunctional riboflavin kinase/FAD synthetase [Fusibacter ferrireducens]MBF4691775.1 bifunctional riboflavin kinase/FAD synthetase [Fusibacter ferrireducens]
MKIYFELEEIDVQGQATSVALGTFDGLHIGHMEVLSEMKKTAESKGLKTFVYTFSNHPREVLTPNNVPPKIMDVDEKTQIFTRFGLDYLSLIKFDEEQLKIEPEDFIKDVLIGKLNMKHLTVGYDYRFGRKARGDVNMLMAFSETYGYTYEIVKPIMKNEIRISSTLIRELLLDGKIVEANFYLGRKHFVKGTVVEGKKLGKTIGVPTANLRIKENISTIKSGVYITETVHKGTTYKSVTNVGYNPTFNQIGLNMETYIFDFDQILYGEQIEVHFIKRLRDEMKFESVDELIVKMQSDLKKARDYFATHLPK